MAMPTIQDHIRVLESELCRLKAVQTCCDHIWGDPVFTLYVEKEGCVILYLDPRRGYGAQLTRAMRDAKKDRWTRTCQKCGLQCGRGDNVDEEHPEKLKAVVAKAGPDFS